MILMGNMDTMSIYVGLSYVGKEVARRIAGSSACRIFWRALKAKNTSYKSNNNKKIGALELDVLGNMMHYFKSNVSRVEHVAGALLVGESPPLPSPLPPTNVQHYRTTHYVGGPSVGRALL